MPSCPSCQQPATKRNGRDRRGRQKYACRQCRRTFTESTSSAFSGYRWAADVILTASPELGAGWASSTALAIQVSSRPPTSASKGGAPKSRSQTASASAAVGPAFDRCSDRCTTDEGKSSAGRDRLRAGRGQRHGDSYAA